jgi:DNA polymerase III subunit delta
MKLNPRQVEAFMARPEPAVAAALLYGPDHGLIRERALALVTAVAGDPHDPFNVAVLGPEALKADPARLRDELGALSLAGGRRVVWVQGMAGDAVTRLEEDLQSLSASSTLLVVEAGALAPREPLRKLFEDADDAVALPCYLDEGADLEALIRQSLKRRGLDVEPDAVAYLTESLGGDRLVIRSELEKLALYKADAPSAVSRADAEACIGDGAPELVDDVVLAAASGDQQALDRTLGRSFAAGTAPISLLRALGRHLQRLHLASTRVAAGENPANVVKALRPPVFWKLQAVVLGQLRAWTPPRLAQALELLLEAELDCKTTGLPEAAICARALMRIAQAARSGTR